MIALRAFRPDDVPLFAAWLAAPHVAKWYRNPEDWLNEVRQADGAFSWIAHFIAEENGTPLGFCQYYACADSGEELGGYGAMEGSYSLDYLIGVPDALRKGYGKQIVRALTEKLLRHNDAKRIVVEPEPENAASRQLLLSCGFVHDEAHDVFVKTLYAYGYCGMPCALCSRYRTVGVSRCPGCSHDGYYTDACKVHHCCREKDLLHCGLCDSFPCKRVESMGEFSDLRTDHAKQRTCRRVAAEGLSAWYEDYAERAGLLTDALERYNDGRRKRYLCELFLRHDAQTLRALMNEAQSLEGDKKTLAKAFREVAERYD